jgi:hypothetical protein
LGTELDFDFSSNYGKNKTKYSLSYDCNGEFCTHIPQFNNFIQNYESFILKLSSVDVHNIKNRPYIEYYLKTLKSINTGFEFFDYEFQNRFSNITISYNCTNSEQETNLDYFIRINSYALALQISFEILRWIYLVFFYIKEMKGIKNN